MNWRELKAHIEVMDTEQQETDVTIHLVEEDEFFAVSDINFSPENDVLYKHHPYLDVRLEG